MLDALEDLGQFQRITGSHFILFLTLTIILLLTCGCWFPPLLAALRKLPSCLHTVTPSCSVHCSWKGIQDCIRRRKADGGDDPTPASAPDSEEGEEGAAAFTRDRFRESKARHEMLSSTQKYLHQKIKAMEREKANENPQAPAPAGEVSQPTSTLSAALYNPAYYPVPQPPYHFPVLTQPSHQQQQ